MEQREIGAEHAAWRAYLQSKKAHHVTDALRAGWVAGREYADHDAAASLEAERRRSTRLKEHLHEYHSFEAWRVGVQAPSMEECSRCVTLEGELEALARPPRGDGDGTKGSPNPSLACQCRSWVYDPARHGPAPFTSNGHHPACAFVAELVNLPSDKGDDER